MRVFHDILGRVDAARRHAGIGEPQQHLGHGPLAGPGLDGAVELVDARYAAGIFGQRGIVAKVVPADRLHEPLEDAVAVACDEYHRIGAAVGVGRSDAGQSRTRGLANDAECAVLGDQALQG